MNRPVGIYQAALAWLRKFVPSYLMRSKRPNVNGVSVKLRNSFMSNSYISISKIAISNMSLVYSSLII